MHILFLSSAEEYPQMKLLLNLVSHLTVEKEAIVLWKTIMCTLMKI